MRFRGLVGKSWFLVLALIAIGSTPSGCARGSNESGGGDSGQSVATSVATDAREENDGGSLDGSRPAAAKVLTSKACAGCHEEQNRFWAYGAHASVACHVCHDVKGDHVEMGETPRMPGNQHCMSCHPLVQGDARAGMTEAGILEHHLRFVEKKHVIKVDRKKVKGRCISCHEPHLGE